MAAEHDINVAGERTVIEHRDPLLDEVFDGRFRVDAKIAAGGFGSIYRATHLKSGHEFALKVLHQRLTSDSRVVARFRREGAALTRLRNPNTITAYELGETPDGMLYIVMELLRGESLFERFRARGALPWQQVVAIARAVCNSLEEAHALGIIHRDLKPTNIHLEPGVEGGDHVKVLDFGIAKIVNDSDIDSSELTHAGQMIGTLDYMSPEQMVGGMCTPASDIYTLGVVMYEMIAGAKPFEDANSPAAALAALLTTTPERLSIRAMVTPEVDRIVMRCLERTHGDRFQSAVELAAALDDILLDRDEIVTRIERSVPSASSSFESAVALTKPLRERSIPSANTAFESAMAVTKRLGGTPMRAPAQPVSASAVALHAAQVTMGNRVRPTPPRPAPTVPVPPAIDHDATLIGPLPLRAASTYRHGYRHGYGHGYRHGAIGSASIDTPALGVVHAEGSVSSRSLRAVYPTIHLPPPSATRPPSGFDDRPSSSVSSVRRYETMPVVRRDATFRWFALAISVAIAIITAIVIAGRLA